MPRTITKATDQVEQVAPENARVAGLSPLHAAPYGNERELLAQFAVAMLREGCGTFDPDDPHGALRNRCKDALKRAKIMLEEFKNFNL